MTEFRSILYRQPEHGSTTDAELATPDAADDIRMHHIVAAIGANRDECGIAEVFRRPLRSIDEISFRHEVFADLSRDELREPLDAFVSGMRDIRRCVAEAGALDHEFQVSRRYLDAVDRYCGVVTDLLRSLAGVDVRSRGLRAFAGYLSEYANGVGFRRLRDDARSILDELDAVRYTVFVDDGQVSVDRYAGQEDYSAEVAELFARFGAPGLTGTTGVEAGLRKLNQVQERVLDCVAALYPDVFRALTGFRDRYPNYVAPTLERFDREVRFYLAYLAYMRRFTEHGLAFSYPDVTRDFDGVVVESGFDAALAEQLINAGEVDAAGRTTDTEVVCNDFRLSGAERIIVVTGPNHSGKTAFARMVGQVLSLAAFGVPVPAARARLPLMDRLYTGFERPESPSLLHSKLEDELTRVHAIVSEADERSVIVLNQSFGSTAVSDAVQIGTEVLNRVAELRCIAVFVTFLDELADLRPETVGMTGSVVADDPARRTFGFPRKGADSRAQADALARRYGLTYRALSERLAL